MRTLPGGSRAMNNGDERLAMTSIWSRIASLNPWPASMTARSPSNRTITPTAAPDALHRSSIAVAAISARERARPVAVASVPSVASSRSSRYEAVMSRLMLSSPRTSPPSSTSRVRAASTTTSRPTERPTVGRSTTRPCQTPVARAISRGSQFGTSTSPTIVASVSSWISRPSASSAAIP